MTRLTNYCHRVTYLLHHLHVQYMSCMILSLSFQPFGYMIMQLSLKNYFTPGFWRGRWPMTKTNTTQVVNEYSPPPTRVGKAPSPPPDHAGSIPVQSIKGSVFQCSLALWMVCGKSTKVSSCNWLLTVFTMHNIITSWGQCWWGVVITFRHLLSKYACLAL